MTTSRMLRLQQAGMEGVGARGTPVTPVKLFPGVAHLNKTQPTVAPAEERGSFFPTYRTYPGLKAADLSVSGDVLFQDLHWWFAMFLKGLTAPTTAASGTGATKTMNQWAFVPTANADNLLTATWQWADANYGWESNFCIGNRLVITSNGGQNAGVNLNATFLTPDRTSQTVTQVADSTRNSILGAETRVFIDDTAAGIGGTQVTGKVMDWSVEVNNNLSPLYFCDGTNKWSDVERGYKTASATMTHRFLSTSELAKWEAGVMRYVRLELVGPLAPVAYGTNPAAFYKLWLDLAGVWDTAPIGERGNTSTLGFRLIPVYDNVIASDIKATVFTTAADFTAA